jgi:acyl carrier protein
MTDSEKLVCDTAVASLGDPSDPSDKVTETTDLVELYTMDWLDKHSLMTELEDQFGIPAADEAQIDAANLHADNVPWVVRDLAKYLDARKARGDAKR